MNILFFDTETTGIYNFNLAASHPSQPHIVQLAAMLCNEQQEVLGSFNFIVNPGVEIPEQAAAVHGITTDKARDLGVPPQLAMNVFETLLGYATLVAAHNTKFDVNVMNAAAWKAAMGGDLPWPQSFCTMEAAAPIVALPPTERMLAAGYNKPKPPRLEECIQHFFGEKLEGAHDAMTDVRACMRTYFHLKTLAASGPRVSGEEQDAG